MWSTFRLEDIARVVAGGKSGLSGKHFVDNGYPAYGAGGLNGFLPTWEHEDGAVVLSSIGARCGKCFLPSGKWSSLANTQLIFPDPNLADRKFLWYLLDDESRWHRSGSAQPYIKPSDVKTHRVTLPPLPEQRRIVSILDEAAYVVRGISRRTQFLDELAGAEFHRVVSESSKHRFRLSEIAEIVGGSTPKSAVVEYWDGDVSWITPADLSRRRDVLITETNRRISSSGLRSIGGRLLPVGSVLLSSRAPIGLTGIVGVPMCTNQGFKSLVPDASLVDSMFLYWWLRSNRSTLESRGVGATFKELSKAATESLDIDLPPLDVQRNFAAVAWKVEKARLESVRQHKVAELLMDSLMSRALEGKL